MPRQPVSEPSCRESVSQSPEVPGGAAPHDPIIVLKFGGSVLGTDADAARVVHEIYRWVRTGQRVVAVVSALEGETDRLLARAAAWTGAGTPSAVSTAAASATAALVATGEQQSAALLGLALDRAGIPAQVLDHAALGLRTHGPALDSVPVGLDTASILAALARTPVIVAPGYTGRDDRGRITLLGRGGSDLSALFIAQRLESALALVAGESQPAAHPRVRCRLVKDVDGLYDRDPALPGPPARRYATLPWAGALALDGTIVQHKGVRFARDHRLAFEVAGLLGARASRVGEHAATFDHAPRIPDRPFRVTLLGAGTVGLGVYESLRQLPRWFEVVRVAARDLDRAAARGIDRTLLTRSPHDALAHESDIVVELIGGMDPALALVSEALRSGRLVATANKAIIAEAGGSPGSIAAHDALACSAAVGGAVPCLETAARLAAGPGVASFAGVLNGTTNFVLGCVRAGEPFDAAVRAAQVAGFAEADPSRDLDGRDAADKVALLARAAFGVPISPDSVRRVGLDAAACRAAPPTAGVVLKHVARAVLLPDGTVRASVTPEWVSATEPLGRTINEENAVQFVTRDGCVATVQGKGAGRWPTAEAVVADLLDLALRIIGQSDRTGAGPYGSSEAADAPNACPGGDPAVIPILQELANV